MDWNALKCFFMVFKKLPFRWGKNDFQDEQSAQYMFSGKCLVVVVLNNDGHEIMPRR